MTRQMTGDELRELEGSGRQYAILDVRDEGVFSKGHLLRASSVPLRQLEIDLASHGDLRKRTLVICDGDGRSEAVIATRRLHDWGFSDVNVLEGGLLAQRERGLPVYSGMHTLSKAFGEAVEAALHTPSITAAELADKRASGEPMCVIDCRPHDEYAKASLPGSINVPGVELAYRFADVVRDPNLPVVVHCAGRTRSIIGTQSLLEAGVTNPVFALENGTMGWLRAGHTVAEPGKPAQGFEAGFRPSVEQITLAGQMRARYGVALADAGEIAAWMNGDPQRTTYLVDIRTAAEYAAGHPEGAIHAAGGQLIQATDKYLFVQHARVVLIDGDGVRASIAAAWLRRMGWKDVFVWPIDYEPMALTLGPQPRRYYRIAGLDRIRAMLPADLQQRCRNEAVDMVDIDTSIEFERGHIAGSRFARRAELASLLAARPKGRVVVLISKDGWLAKLATTDGFNLDDVWVLEGGKAAWRAAGLPIVTGADSVPPDINDVWRRPVEARGSLASNIDEYLSWEIGLADQIRADGAVRFEL
ncbi:MAG: sulfurtransferase [Burkholderiales bacterium]|nr:sulfurtransferase [Burkholderiales bacterium]